MTTEYLYTRSDAGESLLIKSAEWVRTVASTNPRFEAVKEYVLKTAFAKQDLDGDYIIGLLDIGKRYLNEIERLSERVVLRGEKIYFDGDLLDNSISKHLVRTIAEGDGAEDYMPFVNFLENLANNPDRRARRELFSWLQDRDFTLTEDGLFVAYKAVREDGRSKTAGSEPVLVDGVEHIGNIPNPVGAVIEIPRSLVDDDKNSTCSVGLHAGTMGYVNWFGHQGSGDKVLIVVINPRDVVSIPTDHDAQKLRVCRYVVAEQSGWEALTAATYKGKHHWVPEPELVVEEPEDVADDSEPVDVPEDAVQCSNCSDWLTEDEIQNGDYCDSCEEDMWQDDQEDYEGCDICGDFH